MRKNEQQDDTEIWRKKTKNAKKWRKGKEGKEGKERKEGKEGRSKKGVNAIWGLAPKLGIPNIC